MLVASTGPVASGAGASLREQAVRGASRAAAAAAAAAVLIIAVVVMGSSRGRVGPG